MTAVRTKHRWLMVGLFLAIGMVAFGKPVYGALRGQDSGAQWIQVVNACEKAEPPKRGGSDCPTLSEDAFARQLQTITSFYETVIGILLFLVATIATFAFFTLRFVSKQEAAKIAEGVVGSSEFRAKVDAEVSDAVEAQLGDISSTMEELQSMYEALDDIARKYETLRGENNGDSPAA